MESKAMRESRKRVKDAYEDIHPNDLIIRDLLALDRTVLANERTLLSYIRTAFVIAASGFTLIKLLPNNPFYKAIGLFLLPCALITLITGYKRFFRTKRALFLLNEKPKKSQQS